MVFLFVVAFHEMNSDDEFNYVPLKRRKISIEYGYGIQSMSQLTYSRVRKVDAMANKNKVNEEIRNGKSGLDSLVRSYGSQNWYSLTQIPKDNLSRRTNELFSIKTLTDNKSSVIGRDKTKQRSLQSSMKSNSVIELSSDDSSVDSSSDRRCQLCQLPWKKYVKSGNAKYIHIDSCAEKSLSTLRECPEGLNCKSTLESHYWQARHYKEGSETPFPLQSNNAEVKISLDSETPDLDLADLQHFIQKPSEAEEGLSADVKISPESEDHCDNVQGGLSPKLNPESDHSESLLKDSEHLLDRFLQQTSSQTQIIEIPTTGSSGPNKVKVRQAWKDIMSARKVSSLNESLLEKNGGTLDFSPRKKPPSSSMKHLGSLAPQPLIAVKKCPIYKRIEANLIRLKIGLPEKYIRVLPLEETRVVNGVEVTLFDANHCPGAVMFLFHLPTGKSILHVGDFRANSAMESIGALWNTLPLDVLYLDTTYLDPSYNFPSQQRILEKCREIVRIENKNYRNTVYCVGSYCVGKEKVFLEVANELDCKIFANPTKAKILRCLEDEEIIGRLTGDRLEAKVHVVSMSDLHPQKLRNYVNSLGSAVVGIGIKPTGWEYDFDLSDDLENVNAKHMGNIYIYGLPYSEHSSFSDLERFVKFVQPKKIIPTVYDKSPAAVKYMDDILNTWTKEFRDVMKRSYALQLQKRKKKLTLSGKVEFRSTSGWFGQLRTDAGIHVLMSALETRLCSNRIHSFLDSGVVRIVYVGLGFARIVYLYSGVARIRKRLIAPLFGATINI